MITSIPLLPAELQARLAAYMSRKPEHICQSHWLAICEPGCVEVQSCACHDLTGTEARLLRQVAPSGPISTARRTSSGPLDCCLVSPETEADRGHGWLAPVTEPDAADVRGIQDDLAARSLAMRERVRAIKRKK